MCGKTTVWVFFHIRCCCATKKCVLTLSALWLLAFLHGAIHTFSCRLSREMETRVSSSNDSSSPSDTCIAHIIWYDKNTNFTPGRNNTKHKKTEGDWSGDHCWHSRRWDTSRLQRVQRTVAPRTIRSAYSRFSRQPVRALRTYVIGGGNNTGKKNPARCLALL